MGSINDVRGINEAKLEETVLKLYDAAERMKNCFNQIDGLQERVKQCYKGDNSNEYQQRFFAFRGNFDTIVGYIEGYAMDLNKVRLHHGETVDVMVTNLNKKIIEEEKDGLL